VSLFQLEIDGCAVAVFAEADLAIAKEFIRSSWLLLDLHRVRNGGAPLRNAEVRRVVRPAGEGARLEWLASIMSAKADSGAPRVGEWFLGLVPPAPGFEINPKFRPA